MRDVHVLTGETRIDRRNMILFRLKNTTLDRLNYGWSNKTLHIHRGLEEDQYDTEYTYYSLHVITFEPRRRRL